MHKILQHRPLRFVFLANMISMFGSGMNSAGVTWYILQKTHSEMSLGWLLVLTTLPAMAVLPFSGVLIDREDRRHIVMLLDAGRGAVILVVALLAIFHPASLQLWQVYAMNIVVAAGFWMFWPSITALIQELTPQGELLHSNTFLMAGVQGGWLMAGALVGFIYNHVGLGGVLLIDCATYGVSFLCYLAVRSGKQVVARPALSAEAAAAKADGALAHFIHEMREGVHIIQANPYLKFVGISWALFLGAMLTQQVITAPLSDRILHGGAVGYGWMNGGWGVGAFLSTLYTAWLVRKMQPRRAVAVCMATMALGMTLAPYTQVIPMAVLLYFIVGSARGSGGVALSSTLMETVAPHFMGRVQNTFYFAGLLMQLVLGVSVGYVAHNYSLTVAFAMVAAVFAIAFVTSSWPVEKPVVAESVLRAAPLSKEPSAEEARV
jgi:MFS family permease